MIGATDPSVIATFITPDPGLDIARVKHQVAALAEKCRQHNILFDYRPKVHAAADRELLHAWSEARGTVSVSVPARPRRVLGQGIFLPVHPRRGWRPHDVVARRDLERADNVEMRRRLLEHGIFPVCRRCCKVELAPEPVAQPFPEGVAPRRAIPLTVVQ